MSLLRIRKPKTRKGKKVLMAREPQLIEGPRSMLFLDGRKCGGDVKACMKDLQQLKKPLIKVLNRNNDITPFDDPSSLEFLTQKNDCAMFAFGSTSKKRPNNLILGRIFENEILDMVELGIKHYQAMSEFKTDKIGTCVKPCLVFNGPKWSQTEELRRLRNLLIDTFQKDKVEAIRLQGIEHVMSFTCNEDMTILMRSYKIQLKKSGQKTPRIELIEIGPSADFSIRRTKIASEDLYKQARKQPKELKVTKKKNITHDNLGNTHGRVHMGNQNLGKIQTRRVKGLKKSSEEKKADRQKKKEMLKAAAKEMLTNNE
ncbi:putative ribosome production factor 2 [Lucilia cuprina]|uniref:Ribosome production factor 2 homolog n=1 Tax=Lucilia cuprina TaxID=7375 RepID=A0A0L0BXF1_LUCCU|nr:ribosome production factor 2 homolog [Lucilia cuprina]KAI8129524.1 Ribosome production factor 2 like protein [Lucilia cuprina]KNC24671.1 putative ribosome production factor 2 [Lucilia cuprina]